MIDKVVYMTNEIVGDIEQLELRSANQTNDNRGNVEEIQQEEEGDVNVDDDVVAPR